MAHELREETAEEARTNRLSRIKARLAAGDYTADHAWLVSEVERWMRLHMTAIETRKRMSAVIHETSAALLRAQSARDEAVDALEITVDVLSRRDVALDKMAQSLAEAMMQVEVERVRSEKLRAALARIAKNEKVVFDQITMSSVVVDMEPYAMADIAAKALEAAK